MVLCGVLLGGIVALPLLLVSYIIYDQLSTDESPDNVTSEWDSSID